MHFKIDGLALKLEENLPFLLCFTLYLRAISWGDSTEGFLRYEFGGLIFGILRYLGIGLFTLFHLIRLVRSILSVR